MSSEIVHTRIAPRSTPWKFWLGALVFLIACAAVGISFHSPIPSSPRALAEDSAPREDAPQDASVAVTVVHPRKGAMDRVTTQPGTILAYKSVQLFSKVPGFLKSQFVNIGDRVAKGQVLAVVDVPELEKQAQRNRAALKQAQAKVRQMTARITVAKADLDAANAGVTQAEATSKSSAAWVRWRRLQHQRMKDLFSSRSIEEKLVDESKEHYEASLEAEQAALAAIVTSKAKVSSRAAMIVQAEADLAAAESEVDVAQAELERVQIQLGFATITAPFDGVVTFRSMWPGDFVRAGGEGAHDPLLTLHETGKMTVVVQVPDRDVPYADPGDTAYVEIDALPGEPLKATVSRIGSTEDPQTRLMHVEIDLPNPTGKIRQGMYGRVTIVLEKSADLLSIPSSCLVGKSDGNKGKVYVVREGHAHLATVRLGTDNGLRVILLSGLKAEDEVIAQPASSLTDGTEVSATLWDEVSAKTAH